MNFLKKTGRIFVGFSFSFGSKELFDRIVTETGWSYKVYSRNNLRFELAEEQHLLDVSVVEFVKLED